MEETFNLVEVIQLLKKRIVLIISILILAVLSSGAISYYILTPMYEASTQILINQKESEKNQFNTQDIETNLQLINTYSVIIRSPVILTKVIDNLNLDTTADLLSNKIFVNSEQNSQVVNVIVEDPELKIAVDIANMTAQVFQEEIKTLMNIDNVSILSVAVNTKNTSPVAPNPILNIAIAAVVGLMIGVGLVLLQAYLDTTIKTEQDIQEALGLPILGLVSPISKKQLKDNKGKRRSKNV